MWGALLLVPYVLVFAVFVIYPVVSTASGARNPDSYVRLFQDPVFPRTVVNTLIFLLVGVNLKFPDRAWSVGFSCSKALDSGLCPAVPAAVGDPEHSDDPVVPFHAQPRVGLINNTIFRVVRH